MTKVAEQRISSDAAMRGPTTAPARCGRLMDYIQIILLVVVWYTINISLIISNKWLISETGFHSTSLLTLLHMLSSCMASNMALALGLCPPRPAASPALMGRVAVLAASFTVAVASCMASLAYLPASFVQAIGSTTPGFTAVLAFLLQGRREAVVTYTALLPVVVGIVVASGGEPQFQLVGMALQVVACLFRSFKTVLQAVLLTDERDRIHPMTLLAYTSAMSSALLALLTAVTEPHSLAQAAALHARYRHFAPLLAASCGLAFFANWINFIISKRLGALTLQVLGNFKNVVAAMTSVAVFANPVTGAGLAGYGMTTLGVFAYSHLVHHYPAEWVPAPLGAALAYRPPSSTAAAADGAGPDEGSSGGGGGGGGGKGASNGKATAGTGANGQLGDVEYGGPRFKRASRGTTEERLPLLG
ncbi:hypothetical protein PLESTB_000197500 [Pleodorina starrii]|uniref:Sugar phosphate transporter domain-containing protein n=1 Tax=Pleodorina starrii TaxID=330485 RepID=A0A9W6BCQ7_9CHLO|nr:hypothetical protein PLESTM_000334300 [Pleodorina starrii]GLC49237.1 hypothetical protein PLESTB_000197500 [Pleodorina starrii]GLC73510.1 hypothetical protein PLESTF_001385500 [Pleodorina starrii]